MESGILIHKKETMSKMLILITGFALRDYIVSLFNDFC